MHKHFAACFILLILSEVFCTFVDITKIGQATNEIQIAKEQWSYFRVDTLTTLQNMTTSDKLGVLVTPLSGDVDLFISNSNFPASTECQTCWRSISPHGEAVLLSKADERWPWGSSAYLYIGVFSRSISTFTLNTWLTGAHIALKDGQPQTIITPRSQYTYFDFFLDDDSNFTISVTPITTADPDLFVSIDNVEPTSFSYAWRQSEVGVDVLTISSSNTNYRPGPVTYRIGILAWDKDCYYTVAVAKDFSYTTAVEAVPLSGFVEAYKFNYYKFYLAYMRDLTIIVDSLKYKGVSPNDPDIYINRELAEPKPSAINAMWRSEEAYSESFTIVSAEPGWYYIAVMAFEWDTYFQISVTPGSKPLLLYDGVPQHGYVSQGQYSYFRFYHLDDQNGLSVAAIPSKDQEVDLYISMQTINPAREEGKHQFSSFHIGQQAAFAREAPAERGSYFIGVYGRTASNFTIAAASNQSHTILKDGLSTFGLVPQDGYRYFIFDISDPSQDVVIAAKPIIGQVDLYADPLWPYPHRLNTTYRSDRYNQDTITIPAYDPKLKGSQRLFIAVWGRYQFERAGDAYFFIVAFQSETTVEIKDGISTPGATTAGKLRYYKFYMSAPGSMAINLEISGSSMLTEAHLYASTQTTKPTDYDFQYSSTNFGSDYIQIDNLSQGWIYIAVKGIKGEDIHFSITARVSHQYIDANKKAILSSTAANCSVIYKALIWQQCDYILVTVSLIAGRTELHVSNNGTDGPSYKWHSATYPGNAIVIKRDNKADRQQQYWNFKLQTLEYSDYYISVACSINHLEGVYGYGIQLDKGVTRLGIAPSKGFLLYRVSVSAGFDYSVYVRSIKHSIAVYINQDYMVVPNSQNFTIASAAGVGDRIITLRSSTLQAKSLQIAVHAFDNDAYFEITASIISPLAMRFILQEQPQTISIEPDGSTYFKAMPSREARVFYAFAESCDNSEPPVLHADWKDRRPSTSSQYTSSTLTRFSQLLIVTLNPPNSLRELYLGVTNASPAQKLYSIYVSNTAADPRPIPPKNLMYGAPLNSTHVLLKFKSATNPADFHGRSLSYTIFKQAVNMTEGKPEPINFSTVCGVKLNAEFGEVVSFASYNPTEESFEYAIEVGAASVYMVNVIVTDDLGLAAAYEPVWVIDGRVYNAWPGVFLFHVSIGFVALMLMFAALTSYFAFGSVVNAIKGKRGIQIVPNVEFWKDLPFLVLDGIKFLVTCGRAVGTYSSFSDEAPNMDSVEAPVEEAPKEEPKPQQSSSGYGSI